MKVLFKETPLEAEFFFSSGTATLSQLLPIPGIDRTLDCDARKEGRVPLEHRCNRVARRREVLHWNARLLFQENMERNCSSRII